jgi:hypothetical protein
MAKYQLIVQGESGKYTRGDCATIDLDGTTIQEARESARILLVGDKTKWDARWGKDWRGDMVLQVSLDLDDALDLYYGVLLEPDREREVVHKAWIVEVTEFVDTDALRTEVAQWKAQQQATLQQDPEYLEYLRLKKRFG